MPEWAFWTLAASVFIVPAIGFSIMFYLKSKTKKIIHKYQAEELNKTAYIPIALDSKIIEIAREGFWSAEELQFLLNTTKMNNYKNVFIKGKNTGLEGFILQRQLDINVFVEENELDKKEYDFYLSHKDIVAKPLQFKKQQQNDYHWDFVVFKNTDNYDVNDEFDKVWPKLNPKGLVVIVNPDKKDLKKLTSYFKLTQIQHEYITSLNNKLLLVTK